MLPRVVGQMIVHLVVWTDGGGAVGDGGLVGVGVGVGRGGGGNGCFAIYLKYLPDNNIGSQGWC